MVDRMVETNIKLVQKVNSISNTETKTGYIKNDIEGYKMEKCLY